MTDTLNQACDRLLKVRDDVLKMPAEQRKWFFEKEGHADCFIVAKVLKEMLQREIWDDNAECFYSAAKLKELLDGRDSFIVRHGLFDQFVKEVGSEPKRESVKAPVVRLNSYWPKLPDEHEAELFISERDMQRMRPVKGGFMVKVLAVNPKNNSIEGQKP